MACRKRHVLLSVCVIQLVVVIWRQVFDYLGFMWGPILVNFFQIIFVIFGFFGAWQYRAKYLLSYAIWSVFWCGWNVFVICFYENVGVLNREWDLLNLGTGSVSWWEANGPGCKVLFLANQTGIETDPWRPLRPDIVSGCVLPYHHLETVQAFIHLSLAILGTFLGISVVNSIQKEEQSTPSTNKVKKGTLPLYSVEYTPHRTNHDSVNESLDEGEAGRSGGGGSRPMTPRRVKRRSVHSRGSSLPPPYQLTLRRQHASRSSARSSSRRHRTHHQNPVTKLLDHQAAAMQQEMGGHTNLMYKQSSVHSLDDEERPSSARSSYSNFHGTRNHSYRHSHNFLSTGPPAYSSQSETAI